MPALDTHDRIGELCARWIRAVQRHHRAALGVTLALVALLGVVSAARLGVNSDVNAMVAPGLPFRVRELAFQRQFPTGVEAVLVVVEAEDPTTARHAAERLAGRLRARTDQFRGVDLPFGGAFFRRNALLYLSDSELEELADRLASAQPMLAALSRDESAGGAFELLRRALDLRRQGADLGLDLAPVLARVADALEAELAQRPARDPWAGATLLTGLEDADDAIQVISIEPRLDFVDLLAARPVLATIRASERELGLDRTPGLRIRVTGDPILNYEEMLALRSQGVSLAVSSFVCVAGLLYFAFRSVRVILYLLLNLACSVIATAGFAAIAVGDLNQISVAFSILLVGLGVDAGIHLISIATASTPPGGTLVAALPKAGARIGSALLWCTVSTALGFYAFVPTDFLGVAQMGLITGTGMLLSLVLTVTLIPALLSASAPPPERVSRSAPLWLQRLRGFPERHARAICAAAAALALLSVPLLPRLRFDNNAVALRDPRAESVQAFDELLRHAGTSPWTIDVVTPDLTAANALAKKLRRLPEVTDATTLSDYVPDDQASKRELIEAIASFVPAGDAPSGAPPGDPRAAFEALASELARASARPADPIATAFARLASGLAQLRARASGARGAAIYARLGAALRGSLPARLAELRAALSPDEITLASLPVELRTRMLSSRGGARIEVTPRANLSDSGALERFVAAVETIAPDATGPAVVMVEWGRLASRATLQALALAALGITGMLWFQWRRISDVALAIVPLALAALYTAAAMALLGMQVNLVNVIVVPMLLGIGIDSGVHLVESARARAGEAEALDAATARAVVFSALTTLASFISLGYAHHRGMAALGQLLSLGLVATLMCYVVVFPALRALLRARDRSTAAQVSVSSSAPR